MSHHPRVLLLENIHPIANEILTSAGFAVEQVAGSISEGELAQRIADVDLLGIRSKTRVTPRILDAAKNLRAIGAFCIGTNQISLAHARGAGVPVFNAPFSNTRSVAELILAELVMLSRLLGDRSRQVHAGEWRKVALGSHEIRGRCLGIVGYGHIGSQVGVLAEAFGLRVVYHDIAAKLPIGNCRPTRDLGELLDHADFVTLHVPATPQTRNMIGAAELARMKRGACLLNASRGNVVVIDDLAGAIERGHLGGAAIDVFPEEPASNGDPFTSPLCGLPNVILTPHIGGSTEEAQEAIGREVAGALVRYIELGATSGAVNFPPLDLPLTRNADRITNVHQNVPGVLRNINAAVSSLDANIHAQILATDAEIGYLILDVDPAVSERVADQIATLTTSLTTRRIASRRA
jgi:D-3-phosphoglycerate dehydrogenase